MAAMNITEPQFRHMKNGERPLLVDFWAPWCTYCRRIGPAYDQISDQYQDRLTAVKINIDEIGTLAAAEHIDTIPTLVLYRSGKVLGSIVAPDSKAKIDAFLHETLD